MDCGTEFYVPPRGIFDFFSHPFFTSAQLEVVFLLLRTILCRLSLIQPTLLTVSLPLTVNVLKI